jgi:hypothetical protein
LSKTSAIVRILQYVGGLIVGGALFVALLPAPVQQLPALGPGLRKTTEPPAANALVRLIAADDARALSTVLTSDELTLLSEALAPLVEIREIQFVDALTIDGDGDEIAAYVASGRSEQGAELAAGLVLRVREGKVIGVN